MALKPSRRRLASQRSDAGTTDSGGVRISGQAAGTRHKQSCFAQFFCDQGSGAWVPAMSQTRWTRASLGEEPAGRQGSEGCGERGRIGRGTGRRRGASGSALGPVLFSVFICDLEAGAGCTTSTSADGTKLGGAVDSLEGREALRRDLDRSGRWAIVHSVELNRNKCRIPRLGPGNAGHTHKLGEERLERRSGP